MGLGQNALLDVAAISTGLLAVSGTADRNGAAIQFENCDGILIICQFGAIAPGAVTTVKLQKDTASAFSTPTDITGSDVSVAATDDDKLVVWDVRGLPSEQWLRVVVDKDGTNATAEAVVYLKYGTGSRPPANSGSGFVASGVLRITNP